jgi:hypothetical protein
MNDRPAMLRRYAWVLLGGSMAAVLAAWVLWVGGLADNGGASDPNGNPLGIDYAIFHTAGRLLATGEETKLYDEGEFLAALAVTTGVEDQDPSRLFVNPPFYAALFSPLAHVHYRTGYYIWTGIGLAALGMGLRLAGARRWPVVAMAALLFYPVFVGFRLGQNSFLSLLLLAACFALLQKGNQRLAGIALGLLIFKPHLALGVAFWWTIDWRRYRFAWISAVATATTVAIGGWLFWPDATRSYLTDLPSLVGFRTPEFLRSTFSPFGFFSLLVPGRDAAIYGLTILAAIGGMLWFWSYWKDHRSDVAGLFSMSILLTVLISPRVVVYDWTLLLIPAVILARRLKEMSNAWLMIAGLVAMAGVVSIQLTETQLDSLGWAIQVAVPVLMLAAIGVGRALKAKPAG